MDWEAILRAGVRQLQLKPADLWALTPAEFGLLMGLDSAPDRMTRDALNALSELYPDTQKGQQNE